MKDYLLFSLYKDVYKLIRQRKWRAGYKRNAFVSRTVYIMYGDWKYNS